MSLKVPFLEAWETARAQGRASFLWNGERFRTHLPTWKQQHLKRLAKRRKVR